MVLNDNGQWTWEPFWKENWELVDEYNDLVKRWNRAVPISNAGSQDVGRPLAASDARIAVVLRLHKAGKSLRGIADETSLSLRTVRRPRARCGSHHQGTAREDRGRQASAGALEGAEADRRCAAQQVQAVIETGKALVQEAKGLGPGGADLSRYPAVCDCAA